MYTKHTLVYKYEKTKIEYSVNACVTGTVTLFNNGMEKHRFFVPLLMT